MLPNYKMTVITHQFKCFNLPVLPLPLTTQLLPKGFFRKEKQRGFLELEHFLL